MVNIIIPISNNAKQFEEIMKRLTHFESVRVHVGVCESEYKEMKNNFSENENFQIHCFANGSHIEEMINSLQMYLEIGNTMIMRKPISMDEFNKFISQRKEVVTCSRKMGKVKTFFFNLWQKILKLFLGVKLYEGDPSVIYMNEDITAVLSQSNNLSFSSRADRWKGISQGVVETIAQPTKTPVDTKKNFYYILSIVISLALASVVTTVVCIFAKMSIIIGLLVACLDIIAVAVSVILGVMIAFNNTVGKKHFSHAIEIQTEQNADNE